MKAHTLETLPDDKMPGKMPGGIIGLYPDNHERPVTTFNFLDKDAVGRIIGKPYEEGDPLPEQLTPDQRRLLELERDIAALESGQAATTGIKGLLALLSGKDVDK